jgi:hypothetical protein
MTPPAMTPLAPPRALPLSFAALAAAMAVVVTASNILVQHPIRTLGLGDYLTYGALTYPFAFLVTDLANRHLGPSGARRVALVGFACAVALSAWLATPRIAIASGAAFLCAQLEAGRSVTDRRLDAWGRYHAGLAPLEAEAPSLQGAVLIWPVNRGAMRCPCWIVARMASDLRLLPADEPAERLLAMGWGQLQFAAHHGYACAMAVLGRGALVAGLLPFAPILGPSSAPAADDASTLAGIAIGILVFGVFACAMALTGLASTL